MRPFEHPCDQTNRGNHERCDNEGEPDHVDSLERRRHSAGAQGSRSDAEHVEGSGREVLEVPQHLGRGRTLLELADRKGSEDLSDLPDHHC